MTSIELTIKAGPVTGTIQYKELKKEIRILDYCLSGIKKEKVETFIGSVINPNDKKMIFPGKVKTNSNSIF